LFFYEKLSRQPITAAHLTFNYISFFIGKPNKYEIVDFVIGKFKAVLGFGSDTMPAVRDKKEDFIEGLLRIMIAYRS